MTFPHFRNDRVSLIWRRDGSDWQLLAGRRRMGRVVPATQYSGMWRSIKSRGRLSDMANLSHAKNAVLAAAEIELAADRATAPPNCQQNGGVFRPESSLVRQNGSSAPHSPKTIKVATSDGREFEVPGESNNLTPTVFAAILNKLRAAP